MRVHAVELLIAFSQFWPVCGICQAMRRCIRPVYIALGILPDGTKHVLGLWIEQTEGAKFWLRVMNELKTRSTQDILIAVADGLKGFPEAINAVFPQTVVQTCIVHLIRHSMNFAAWKDRKGVAKALRAVRIRGHFPSDDAASKLLYLVLNQASNGWKRPPREWFMAKTQFAVLFGERFVNQ